MEILKNFGFEPLMLVAQIVNFLIIIYILKKLLYKPVFNMLKKREDEIKEGIKKAEEGALTLENALKQEEKILKKAQEQSKLIVENANQQATETAKRIEENTKLQAEKIMQEAKDQIDQEAKEAEKRISDKISILAAQLLTKSLKEMFGEKEQKQLLTKALKEIKKAD